MIDLSTDPQFIEWRQKFTTSGRALGIDTAPAQEQLLTLYYLEGKDALEALAGFAKVMVRVNAINAAHAGNN